VRYTCSLPRSDVAMPDVETGQGVEGLGRRGDVVATVRPGVDRRKPSPSGLCIGAGLRGPSLVQRL
jgi:hypothetical protein